MSAALPQALHSRFQRSRGSFAFAGFPCDKREMGGVDPTSWPDELARRSGRRGSRLRDARKVRVGKLAPHRASFEEVLAQDGDITMPEFSAALHEATAARADPYAVGKLLRKLGYSCKKDAGGLRTSSRTCMAAALGV